jgi:ATP-dependent helicase HrpB
VLPISSFIPQIHELLVSGSNLVLQAAPGAGKSTALPMSLLDLPWLGGKKIIMLEPRRVAAKSIAHYLAGQLGEKVGGRIGYQVKNDRKVSKETVLEIVTEGILTRRLQNDSELSDVALVIFDEFHERSVHADLSLMLCLEVQQVLREDLKLLVMSATIDTGLISRYMDNAEVIKCPGRVFPVSVDYVSPRNNKELLSNQVVSVLRGVLAPENTGDTLVFLPGQAEIRQCLTASKSAFSEGGALLFLPLYGGLSISQQEQALVPDPGGKRRVVFTTNLAETSLTIEGVTCVIDSGLERVSVFDPKSSMSRLETTHISKASAEQRKGRAGRTRPGHCIRLWGEQKHRELKDFQGEEILTVDLTGFLLELLVWGAGDYAGINWLTAPPRPHFESARQTLLLLGLINAEGGITALGRKTAGMGLPPRLATMLLQATDKVDKGIACELAALLADRDIFYRSSGVDIVARMLALQEYKLNRNAALNAFPLNRSSVEQVIASAGSLGRVAKINQHRGAYSLVQLQDSMGSLLLSAYPDRLAKRRSASCGRYQLANGRGVFLFDDDPLYGQEWLVVADCDAQKKDGRIYSAAPISYESMIACLGDLIREEDRYSYDSKKQKITGRCVTGYGAIAIKSTVLSKISSARFQDGLLHIIKGEGLGVLNWSDRCERWLTRAQWLGANLDGFPDVSKQGLVNSVDEWLMPYLIGVASMAELRKVNVYELLVCTLSWAEQKVLDKEAPLEYQTPSNKKVSILYGGQQGPTVSVRLQEMFGEVDTPLIAGGNVPIRFELLSPARRPIQTTSDLGGFWRSSYFELAKEMRGRYPKHRWPEEPLLEKPGRSMKPR